MNEDVSPIKKGGFSIASHGKFPRWNRPHFLSGMMWVVEGELLQNDHGILLIARSPSKMDTCWISLVKQTLLRKGEPSSLPHQSQAGDSWAIQKVEHPPPDPPTEKLGIWISHPFCWWSRNPANTTCLMHHLSHYLQGLYIYIYTSQVVFSADFWTINSYKPRNLTNRLQKWWAGVSKRLKKSGIILGTLNLNFKGAKCRPFRLW